MFLPEPSKDSDLPIKPNAALDHDFPETTGFVFSPLVSVKFVPVI